MRFYLTQEVTRLPQILSGRTPFSQYQPPALVMAVVLRNERPPKEPHQSPKGVSYAEYWNIAAGCWAVMAGDRPMMTDVLSIWPSPTKLGSKEYVPPIPNTRCL